MRQMNMLTGVVHCKTTRNKTKINSTSNDKLLRPTVCQIWYEQDNYNVTIYMKKKN